MPSAVTDTAEVRWFRPGALPDDAVLWFESVFGDRQARRARVDLYVRSSSCPDLGVKLRDGRLEMKQRLAVDAIRRLGRSEGAIERWRKVSFAAAPVAAAGDGPLGGLLCRPVGKDRRIGWLVPDGARPSPVPAGAPHDAACQVELAAIVVDGAPWWTIGFEWASAAADRAGGLAPLAARVLDGAAAPRLDADACAGYPAWLTERLATA